jgi:formylmethanofuran dehydrogenase subunit E
MGTGAGASDLAMEPAIAPIDLSPLLAATAALHHHLCPRQVLGVRVGLAGAEALNIAAPQPAKRLLTIIETDGCFCDGIAVATNCWVGRRTMRIEDCGKTAATFVDTVTEAAVRVCPRPDARSAAAKWAPEAANRWQAQLIGYQRMPADQLLCVQTVRLHVPVQALVSRPGRRVACSACGEEILNERERRVGDLTLCRACAGEAYYTPVPPAS